MITHWFLFCFVHNLVAQQTTPVPSKGGIDIKTKPIMCDYKSTGPYGFNDKTIPELSPECIPCECDIIVFDDCNIDNKTNIVCDTKLLNRLASVKPVIVGLYRTNNYNEWVYVLKNEKIYTKEVDALIDFAKKNDVIGYRLNNLIPVEYLDTFDINVGIKHVDYIHLMKEKSNLIVGYCVYEYESVITNPCVTPFAELNGVVDFYTVRTDSMNVCRNELYNGLSPIKLTNHGKHYMMSMEEVWKFLEESECDLDKVYLIADVLPTFTQDYITYNNKAFVTYGEVCSGIKTEEMCIPDTNQLYAKGCYMKGLCCGLTVRYISLDNFDDDCGCGTFVAIRNLYAGYHGKEKIPCKKFDVQKSPKGYE